MIDVAERLLAERQVSTITTPDITPAAEVSDGVLYSFADMNDLLMARVCGS
jgi:Bacterial regulatory proteins, tetR family